VKTFGINSAFTTTDQNHYREFVKSTKDLLTTTPGGWKIVVAFARELVHKKFKGVPRNQGFLIAKQ
jgi:hypothetical protein